MPRQAPSGFQQLGDDGTDSQLGDDGTDSESWPQKMQLMELMDERESGGLRLLSDLTGGGGAEKLASMLGSSAGSGLSGEAADLDHRKVLFGANAFREKEPKSYLELVWDALHDAVLIMLLVLAAVQLPTELVFGKDKSTAWIEPTALFLSVFIIVNVSSATDYVKERQFKSLAAKLNQSNKKVVVRRGEQTEVTDAEIVVGDVIAFNAHSLASLPCDGVLLSGSDVKVDESSLTGEPDPMPKTAEAPFCVSGTDVVSGSGRMLVVAVGPYSVSGKIKMAVYHDEEEDDEASPLFVKLNGIVEDVFKVGLAAAVFCFLAMVALGIVYPSFRGCGEEGCWDFLEVEWLHLIEYMLTAITVLAVAVPEGLPLAVNLALAFSSQQMMAQNNLVKHLDACETMGSATTICSDKTGTLTANRMSVRAVRVGGVTYSAAGDSKRSLGRQLVELLPEKLAHLLAHLICVDTMDESFLEVNEATGATGFKGNPTECALLSLVAEMGYDYAALRHDTPGRSLATAARGKPFMFSSKRKMMSWAVPLPRGGYRVYCKGASEIVIARCDAMLSASGEAAPLSDAKRQQLMETVVRPFAGEAYRTIALAYRDLPGVKSASSKELEATHSTMTNADGSAAYVAETGLTLLALTGIADPLRPEVPGAIERCNRAGIDVRMVTGDNLDTAVAIAKNCGILRPQDLEPDPAHAAGERPKPKRALEGREFRALVHRTHADGSLALDEEGKPEFLQTQFDKVWPYLRVLARSSPADKLTLANGLNKSTVFADAQQVEELRREGIVVFPDRQVVAMTGDGTNDAPALKRADVGFAMGVAGTQIAKDACDIVLLDDNFASIVVAAKWGRNVYASISKFLQFQLTVNIVAVSLAIIGSIVFQESPIAAVQMLWVNLIMDSLASLALSTEPPSEELLARPPVNRSTSIVTRQMWINMLGQAAYQLGVTLFVLFHGAEHFHVLDGHDVDNSKPSVHYTILFNAFVLMTLCNEVNCRKLEGEFNVFAGVCSNAWFVGVLLGTLVLQVLAVQFGGRALRCAEGGLTTHQWLFCVGAGLFSLVWQQALNCYSLLSRRVDARRKRIKKKPAHGGAVKFMSRTGNGFQEFRRSNPYLGKSLSTLRFSPSSKTAPDLISAVAGTGPVAVSRPSSY